MTTRQMTVLTVVTLKIYSEGYSVTLCTQSTPSLMFIISECCL